MAVKTVPTRQCYRLTRIRISELLMITEPSTQIILYFFITLQRQPIYTLFPYTTLFRSNQKEIAEMQNETQKEIAGIQSATSRQNTKDQVYAQNEMLAYQQKESTARVASIMENTNLSKQQQVSEIMRQMLTQA